MADPYLLAAGSYVLLGLGCLGADLYNIAAPGGHSTELWSAESIDLAAGLAAAALLIYRGGQYLTQAGGSLLELCNHPESRTLSPILSALALAEAIELLMGFGDPYQGDDLRAGARQLQTVGAQLQSTVPGSSWRGTAAQNYSEQVAADQGIAAVLATLDAGLADGARHVADFVTHARLAIGLLKSLLLMGYVIEQMYYAEEDIEDGWTFAGKAGTLGAVAVGAIGIVFGLIFALGLHDGAVSAGVAYDMVGKQPIPPHSPVADVAAANQAVLANASTTAAALPTASVTAPQSDAGRIFFGTATEEAATTPTTALPTTPSLAPPAPPAAARRTAPRGYTRPAPRSEPVIDPAAPPAEAAQPDLEAGERAPVGAAAAGRPADIQPQLVQTS
ncbi:MAG: hypothetical protein K2Q25_06425 [Mycobacteriaceae bacterium]|nr:hypothetical protein [Mycobacteriaceae bacterium]